jgi:hypothetical protein
VVDRADVVNETNENDNQRNSVLLGQAGGCVTKLEFEDPLRLPTRCASLSLAAGGSPAPDPGRAVRRPGATLYLIAWTGSGTSPGTALAPGVTLPLNPDG